MLIAYFEPADRTHDVAATIVDDLIRAGRNAAVVSTVTAMELLVRPLRVAPKSAVHVRDFLTRWPNLSLLSVDLHVAQEAASLRAAHNFLVADALVIATGLVGQVAHLLTNDVEWRKELAPIKARVQVTELRDYI